ncbi:MAG: Fe-S cluster assembly protein SufB, partial [Acidimicrobiales bacterium]
MATTELDLGRYQLGWNDGVIDYAFTPKKGVNEAVVREISWWKGEPDWMLAFRLKALRHFERMPMKPWFAVNMPDIDFDEIYYYLKPSGEQVDNWDDLPEKMKETYEKLGIPEAERKYLAGVTAQYESEVVYHKNREDLEAQGILFSDMDTAVREHPEIVRRFFGKIIPPGDNKFAALNSAVWSGGSFIYIPPGVNCEMPLQAYFRINSENAGQFERTLIIADEGSQVHYIEGCSAPVYSGDSLHSAVVELVALPGSRITYTTIQNWSPNVYNLVTKRARVEAEGHMEWIDGNIGSKLTMKYPSVYLMGPKASGEVLSVAYAGAGQHQDAGAQMVHAAPET